MGLSLRNSRLNPRLQHAVVDIYSQLVLNLRQYPARITVLSFYKSFAESLACALRNVLRENGGNASQARLYTTDALDMQSSCVSTIDNYQGEENEIVIVAFSTFQEDALSWTSRAERLNVAASRAKGAVIFMLDWNRMAVAINARPEGTKALQAMRKFALEKGLVVNYDEKFPANLQVLDEVPGTKRGRNANAEGGASSFKPAVRAKHS